MKAASQRRQHAAPDVGREVFMDQPKQDSKIELPKTDKMPWQTPRLIVNTLDSAEGTGSPPPDSNTSS